MYPVWISKKVNVCRRGVGETRAPRRPQSQRHFLTQHERNPRKMKFTTFMEDIAVYHPRRPGSYLARFEESERPLAMVVVGTLRGTIKAPNRGTTNKDPHTSPRSSQG
jgi:hypothetical protein